MSCRVLRCAILTVLVLAALATPALAGKPLVDIPLVWKPTEIEDVGVINLSGITNVKIQLEPLRDTRPEKTKIGENQEDSVPKPVTTSGSVADFCTRYLGELLRQFGFSLVEQGGDFVLGGEVLDFMVIETNTYKGQVRLKLSLKRRDKADWTGLTSGVSKRFGRSYKAENYYETVSDALLHAVENLARDDGFQRALATK